MIELAPPPAGSPDGPRDRLARLGVEPLSDAELVALVLGTGLRGETALRVAESVLAEAGGVRGLSSCTLPVLASRRGIGETKAGRIVAALELGRRSALRPLVRGAPIASSRDVDASFRPRLSHAESERFVVLALDARQRVVREIVVATGSVSHCPVAPSEVFRALLREAASAAVLVHNHPSGDPTPSRDDVELTKRLVDGARLLGLRIVDHVIVAESGYVSFVDAGLLTPG
jgi:DNA repair protein RadC